MPRPQVLLVVLLAGCAATPSDGPEVQIDGYSLGQTDADVDMVYEVDYVPIEGVDEHGAIDSAASLEPDVWWMSADELLEGTVLGTFDADAEVPLAMGDGETGRTSQALACGGACIAGAVVAIGRLGMFVWRIVRAERVVHATATVATNVGTARVGLNVTGAARTALGEGQLLTTAAGAVRVATTMEALSDRYRTDEDEDTGTAPVTREDTAPCELERLFVPERSDVVMYCLTAAGATQCTSRPHYPCVGDHTHGTWMFQYPSGARCVQREVRDAVRCDGPIGPAESAAPCSDFPGSRSCGGEQGLEWYGHFCNGTRCPYSDGYVGP